MATPLVASELPYSTPVAVCAPSGLIPVRVKTQASGRFTVSSSQSSPEHLQTERSAILYVLSTTVELVRYTGVCLRML